MLGNEVLNPREALSLSHGGYCWWDIKLVLDDEWDMAFEGSVNSCELTKIRFYCTEDGCNLAYEGGPVRMDG